MATDDYTLRTLTADDLDEYAGVVATAFLSEGDLANVIDAERTVFEPDRTVAVLEGGRFAGVGGILTRSLTLPGGRARPVAGVTSIAVRPDQRRRGVLSRIMRAQLDGLHESGAEPIAALWASEAAIYGRFGYGLATDYIHYEITAKTPFRPGVDLGADRVREVARADAIEAIKPIYERHAATTVGALSRPGAYWEYHLLDTERRRAGASPLRFAVHPDGYAVYRVKGEWSERAPDGRLMVRELVATTPRAYAALVRYLLDVDLIGMVELDGAVDEPLTLLLQTPRAALRKRFDGLFIRLVDLDRALVARDYAADVDVVIEVADEWCPWNAGRWRFTAKDAQATVERTTADADLSTSSTELGAAFLGGTRLTMLAAAGRVHEHTPGAVARLSAAFLGEREPACVEVF
ncbi:Enhanced intracellular survival protein [Alloactinosynnema sp. L-07]|uniref:GNAT family N-acetyltransferase n=1 Tax=Alloactinosynnema sp. L-07 TaxID=1653480 RepID=UPI00065EEF77|nr:GNAT family N-acetyltransferase [Alloactinosynnema sp. L-07]CRK55380.1 Enhanced intracellular survival protein [Alloactinosynnema sp. L-07]